MENKFAQNTESRKYMLELKAFCNKLKPFVTYYDKLITSYNNTAYNNLEKEIKLLLPQVKRKQNCGIITTLVSSLIGLAYEGISSFLHHKQINALHKAVIAMNDKANIHHNKLMKLDDTMLMYGIYNVETLEKLIKTVHKIHNTTSSHEKLFAGKHNHSVFRILYPHSLGMQHYSINSLLYLRLIQVNIKHYIENNHPSTYLCISYEGTGEAYLPNSLKKPAKLQVILSEVKKTLQITNPDYNLVLDRLHLFCDIQLVTFSIDKDMNLIIQFPVFIQPYTQKPLILYQIETVPVPIIDRNTKAQSYTHL